MRVSRTSRVLALAVVALLILASLAGCVQPGEDSGSGPDDGGGDFSQDENADGEALEGPRDEDACPPPEPPVAPADADARDVRLEVFASGFDRPLEVTHAGDCSHRLFIVEKPGLVRVWRDGSVLDEPFLDLTDRVTWGGERGLLSLAFHPEHAVNGRVFAAFTDHDGDVVVAGFEVDAGNPDRVDRDTEVEILRVPQPYDTHNGGQLAFGPDGFLYVSLGDGGSAGDPEGNAQDRGTILGAILRLDVDDAGEDHAYGIPADNPFAGEDEFRDEVWAFGLRNPWRFSFDRETGDLWIADVGQNRVEEVNVQPAGSRGGENYGWPAWEGSERYSGEEAVTDPVFPVHEALHEDGACAAIGGFVYRGILIPALEGAYVFSDMCAGDLWALTPDGDAWSRTTILDTDVRPVAFGEDEAGELYVVDHLGGTVYRVLPE